MATILVAIEVPDNLPELQAAFPSLSNDSMAEVARESVTRYTAGLTTMHTMLTNRRKHVEQLQASPAEVAHRAV